LNATVCCRLRLEWSGRIPGAAKFQIRGLCRKERACRFSADRSCRLEGCRWIFDLRHEADRRQADHNRVRLLRRS
jgi:hypothetical protein